MSSEDAINFASKLRAVGTYKNIDIIIHNRGSLSAAETIINSLSLHKSKIRVHTIYYACSACNLIALPADMIIMYPYSYIGPVDPQYSFGVSATNISRFNESTSTSWVGDIVKLMRDDSTRSMNRVEELVSKICSTNSIHDGKLVCKELASSKYNHDQPIFYRDICEK